MAQKIIYWLLITLVLSLGFGQLLRFEYFGLPIYLHDMLVVCILVLHGLTYDWRSVLKRKTWLQAKLGSAAAERTDLSGTLGLKIFLSGLTLGWLRGLTLFPPSNLLIPSLYTLRLLAYLALYLIIKKQKIVIPPSVFLLSGLVTLAIGLLQYFLMPDMRVFQYLGWDDHLNRLTLPHFDPTFTAIMLTLSAIYFYQQNRGRIAQLFLPAIFLTYSRSIWLALIVVGTIYAFQTKKYTKLILALALLGIVIMLHPSKFGEGTNLLRLFSVESRLAHDTSYIQKYKWDLLIGRGMNTLILDTPSGKYDNHATGPNNSYLYLLATTGVLGLVGWGLFMYSIFQKSAHRPMLIFFFIASLFNNVMFYPFALLWVLLVEAQSDI